MRMPRIEIGRTRRRVLAQLAGVLTGTAVALTLVQFSAARRERTGQDD